MSQFSKRHFHDTDIKELIYQYKMYDCLWNLHSPDYKNKSAKQKAWLEIAHYFQKEISEVKRKVQYLRTAYVHEKRKVDAARRSGKKPHKPSLFYYKELDFLDNMVIWRKFGNDSKQTDSYFENCQTNPDVIENEFIPFESKQLDYLIETDDNCKIETFSEDQLDTSSPQSPIINPQSPADRPERRKLTSKIEPLENSILLNDPSKRNSINPLTKRMYISFGNTIALQLQQLPMKEATLAMSEIQSILTEKILEHINSLKTTDSESEKSCREIEEHFDSSI